MNESIVSISAARTAAIYFAPVHVLSGLSCLLLRLFVCVCRLKYVGHMDVHVYVHVYVHGVLE